MHVKKVLIKILLIIGLLQLVACSSVTIKESTNFIPRKLLVANGYAQTSIEPQLSLRQSQYKMEQAAKIEAYRELAKQLYSEKVTDRTTVADQVIKDETFRTYLDLFLREAIVKDFVHFADQKKITLELSLSPRFYYCFSSTVDVVTQCLKQDNKTPFTRVGYKQVPLSVVNLDCISSYCDSQISVSGFSKKKNSVDSAMLSYGLYDSDWTINMALKSALRYFALTKVNF